MSKLSRRVLLGLCAGAATAPKTALQSAPRWVNGGDGKFYRFHAANIKDAQNMFNYWRSKQVELMAQGVIR